MLVANGGTRKNGGADPQSPVSVPNTPGLTPESLRRVYDVKSYVLLIAIVRRLGTLILAISFEKIN